MRYNTSSQVPEPKPGFFLSESAKAPASALASAHIEMEDAPSNSSTAKRYGGTRWVPMTGPDTLAHPTFSPHPLPHTRPISKVASQKRPPARCVDNAAMRKPGRRLASPRVPGASVCPNGPHSILMSVCGTVCCPGLPPTQREHTYTHCDGGPGDQHSSSRAGLFFVAAHALYCLR